MAILTLRVKGQTLTVESKIDKIVENSVNYLDYEIIYDDEKWNSPLAKKIVVTYDKKTYEIFGDKIPSQVIHAPGFTVSVIGYKSGSETDSGIIITTSPVAIKVFPSGATEGTIPEDTAIDLSVAEQLNEKIEIQANEIKNNYLSVNTAMAELEKGTIPTMDKVNVWELEAGVYYVNSIVFYATPHPPVYPNSVEMQSEKGLLYVHVDISNNNSRDFYLFANGNIYFGTSMSGIENEGVGSISSVVADIRNEITNDNVDGIPTKKAVYNYGETIKTELLTDIGNKADRTEVETALNGKVNKSDVLSNIDKNAQPEDIYNAPIVNTALATLEQGIFKALPSDTVNVWELESGLYRVTANTTINNGINSTLIKPANPYSYLYVSGKSYTGTTDQRYVVGWAYLASIIYENSFAAKVFTGATYTDGTVKEHASELATVTKLTALENRLDTKLGTALNEKVNKSDILSNIDINAKPEGIYNAPAVNAAIAALEKGTIKTVTDPNLWELESGIYHIIGGFHWGKYEPPINPRYIEISDGFVFITKDHTINTTTNYYIITHTATNNRIYYGNIITSTNINIETGEETIDADGNVNWCDKTEIINENSTHYQYPTAKTVFDFVNESFNKLQGNLDEVSALVGGA